MTKESVDDMKPSAVRKNLKKLIVALDELDMQDELGTEGWRFRLGFEE